MQAQVKYESEVKSAVLGDRTISVNLDAVDKETLVDASGFVFDNSLPLEKRAARMLEQLKNPYCFRYGDMAIKLEFAEDGPSLQELLTGFFLRQKSGL